MRETPDDSGLLKRNQTHAADPGQRKRDHAAAFFQEISGAGAQFFAQLFRRHLVTRH